MYSPSFTRRPTERLIGLVEFRRGHRRSDVFDASLKVQQYTSPVMAEAKEDAVFNRHIRLTPLKDVSNEPNRFGIRPGDFHETDQHRLGEHLLSMLAKAPADR